MNNAILANIELSDTYLVNSKVNTNTTKPTQTPKGVKNKKTRERMLYLLSGDTELVADLMGKLNSDGIYTVPESLLAKIQNEFWADYCDDAMGEKTMGKVWKDHGYLCDPHTAAGWAAAENYVNLTGDTRPMVVLSTASPYKFPQAVLTAIGQVAAGDGFDQMEQLHAVTGVAIPKNLATLRTKAERHTGVIGKTQMLDFVLGL